MHLLLLLVTILSQYNKGVGLGWRSDVIVYSVITSDKGGGKCVCPRSFDCLSVCLSVC